VVGVVVPVVVLVVVGAVLLGVVVRVVVGCVGVLGVAVVGLVLIAATVFVGRGVLAEVRFVCVVAAGGGGDEPVTVVGASVASGAAVAGGGAGGAVWVRRCRVGVGGGVLAAAVVAGNLVARVGGLAVERRPSATLAPAASANTTVPARNASGPEPVHGRRRRR
jgi:hypothetical protein